MGQGAGVRRVRRLGGRLLLSALLGSTCFGMLVVVRDEARAQAPRQIGFAIPAWSPLSGTLAAFGGQASLQVTYLPEARGRQELGRLVRHDGGGRGAGAPPGRLRVDLPLHQCPHGRDLRRPRLTRPPGNSRIQTERSRSIPSPSRARRRRPMGRPTASLLKDAAAGTKSETPIIETPASVSVVDRKQLDTQNPQSVPDALRCPPGVVTGFLGNDTRSLDAADLHSRLRRRCKSALLERAGPHRRLLRQFAHRRSLPAGAHRSPARPRFRPVRADGAGRHRRHVVEAADRDSTARDRRRHGQLRARLHGLRPRRAGQCRQDLPLSADGRRLSHRHADRRHDERAHCACAVLHLAAERRHQAHRPRDLPGRSGRGWLPIVAAGGHPCFRARPARS